MVSSTVSNTRALMPASAKEVSSSCGGLPKAGTITKSGITAKS